MKKFIILAAISLSLAAPLASAANAQDVARDATRDADAHRASAAPAMQLATTCKLGCMAESQTTGAPVMVAELGRVRRLDMERSGILG